MPTYIALRALDRSASVNVPSVVEVLAPTGLAETHAVTTGTLTAGTYYYKVTAVGAGGGETNPTSAVSRAVVGGNNEVQNVTVDATAGQFTLTYSGQTTTDIAFNASATTGASSVRALLEALSNIGTGNVTVSGGPGNSGGTTPYVVTFTGTLGNLNVSQMTAASGTTPLSGGGATVAVTTQTQGRGSDVVHLSWTASTSAATYNVYRATNSGFTTGNKKLGNTASVTFDDNGVAGTTASPPTADTAVSSTTLVRLSTTADAVVDLDDIKTRRALGRHRAIGQYVVTAVNSSVGGTALPSNS